MKTSILIAMNELGIEKSNYHLCVDKLSDYDNPTNADIIDILFSMMPEEKMIELYNDNNDDQIETTENMSDEQFDSMHSILDNYKKMLKEQQYE